MWDYFQRLGISESSLSFFIEEPYVPDIAGFNYYVTSERFLDDNLEKYDARTHGGNEIQSFADVELVRVNHQEKSGLKCLLTEAWERYQIPMAITEAHLDCSREEQMRWFYEIWNTCVELNKEGIPVKAVTAWALLGSFGWNNLLTSEAMDYETGAFDISSGKLRPTALVTLLKDLTSKGFSDHPVLSRDGWWKKKPGYNTSEKTHHPFIKNEKSKPLLILGKTGTLGKAFATICHLRGLDTIILGRDHVDITRPNEIEWALKNYKPWAVINTTGFVKVDEAESQKEKCFLVNTIGPLLLAEICTKYNIKHVAFSSDLVFDGNSQSPYSETDIVSPLNIYGQSKSDAEKGIKIFDPEALIIRTSSFFGPWDRYNFVYHVLDKVSKGGKFYAPEDIIISPTYVPDLVNATLDLLIDNEKDVWHITNDGVLSWYEFALEVVSYAGLCNELVLPQQSENMNFKAKRPKYSALTSSKGIILPPLQHALQRFFVNSLGFHRDYSGQL
jgi:dTDP-4-dehydrorhamnose reductase